MSSSIPEAIASGYANGGIVARMLVREDTREAGKKLADDVRPVARHDSGVPEDLVSPCPAEERFVDATGGEEPDASETEETRDGAIDDASATRVGGIGRSSRMIETADETGADYFLARETRDAETPPGVIGDFTPDGKDSGKDGSDSGVEGCANCELARVEYASGCNGHDEASRDSSLASRCSVYEDPCAIIPDDRQPRCGTAGAGVVGGAELGTEASGGGTSEGGSESSSLAGSCSGPRLGGRGASTRRGGASVASSSSGSASGTLGDRKNVAKELSGGGGAAGGGGGGHATEAVARSSTSPRTKIRGATTGTSSRGSSSARNQGGTSLPRDRGGGSRESRSATREIGQGTTTATERRCSTAGGKLRNSGVPMNSIARTRTRRLPDSLPSSLTAEIERDLSAARRRGAATPATPRSRGGSSSGSSRGRGGCTPGSTPGDDSRSSKSFVAPKNLCDASRGERGALSHEVGDKKTTTTTLDAYATLPRANKSRASASSFAESMDRGEEALVGGTRRNEFDRSPNPRDGGLGRANPRRPSRATAAAPRGSKDLVAESLALSLRLPKGRPGNERTVIFHEIGVQTGLTGRDVEDRLAGAVEILRRRNGESLETETQTEEVWEDVRRARNRLRTMGADLTRLRRDNDKLEAERTKLERLLSEERADHAFARQELDKNARRVLAMLGTPRSDRDEPADGFLELETHFQSSGQVVAGQRIEIADLRSLCRMLNRDLEKSLAAQKSLLQQQQEFEADSTEMQDFLQEEKATLAEALGDAEAEIERKNELVIRSDVELARLTEECKHLVRMSEQRRQENLSLGMKLNAVERRSRELLLGQGAAVSGASVALSGLATRLEGLVEQLVRSYKISEKDLEDVIYHNEAYSRSNSSAESSPIGSKQSLKECAPSPKRGSFVSAVIGAIRNAAAAAAAHPFTARSVAADKRSSPTETSNHIFKEPNTESDLLDFETEPCLMMESVLEDVPQADTYSRNMISSSDSLRRALSVPEPIEDPNARDFLLGENESASLTNLTQAILNRRKAEDEEDAGGDRDSPSVSDGGGTETNSTAPITDYCPAVNLVDQVIDVDNLVTKLLKVLRIIQLDNDTCIRDLREDKSELESKLETRDSELEELRKLVNNVDDALESDEIFVDAVDHRRRTVLENRTESFDNKTNDPVQDQESNGE